MGRKQTIFVDEPLVILRRIAAAQVARISELEGVLARAGGGYGHGYGHIWSELKDAQEGWIKYDIAVLSGRDDFSDSERIRWQQAVRKLEAEGLVEIIGVKATQVRLTAAGTRFAKELATRS